MTLLELLGILCTAVALLGYLNHRFVHLPDTIGITAMGLLLSLALMVLGGSHPAATQWAEGLAHRLDLTDVVLHGLLSVLLFAGSLHINLRDLRQQKLPVVVLSTVGVVLSTFIVGGLGWLIVSWAGAPLPLAWCLVFGALISPTDPIAVIGVLTKAGVPKSLETAIAGESLFNDGTGVVTYLLLLGLATGTVQPTASGVLQHLLVEVGGALALGLALGWAGFYLLHGVDSYPVEIMITLAVAVGGYALAERMHVSAPLAVVVAGLVVGNQGAQRAMSAQTREHLFDFWQLLDEVLNLVLFGLIGLQLLVLPHAGPVWGVAAALVPVVLLARFLSVGIPALVLRPWLATYTPHAVKILTWGGLKGGISVALALSLPAFEGRQTLIAATYCVVLFSLLVQATTLERVLKKLGVCRECGAPGADQP